jgi:pyridoxal phosphate enzyme (YggS family)
MLVDLQAFRNLRNELTASGTTLVAVSKTKPAEAISALYAAGQRDFGENYVQELCDKYEQLPKNIRWHFIGHLQRNKVKQIAPFIHLIHGVDSLRLLEEINKQGLASNRVIPVLLQVFIASEETKFGLDTNELNEITELIIKNQFPNVLVRGLMGMASFTENQDQVAKEFSALQTIFKSIKTQLPSADTLSMGMSGDYKLALQCGSTMIRIGSALFGERKKID